MNRLLLAALAAICIPLTARALDATSAADRVFIATVSQGGMFEVQAGQLAADQGSSQDIKDSGATEAHDHKLVGDRLASIAADAGITFPETLNADVTKELADLKSKTGSAFDASYLQDMEAIHAKDGAAFAKEAANGSNPKLKVFAAETHRIVLRHIGELKALPARS